MPVSGQVPTLVLKRSLGCVEEYTLLPEKVRLDAKGPFQRRIVEVPLRFLDSIWVVEKGTTRARCLFYALAMTALAAYLIWAILNGRGEHRTVGVTGIAVLWILVAPFCLALWWASRFNAVVFPSMHPQFEPFMITRTPERELEVLEFADAVKARILAPPRTEAEGG